MGCADDGGGNRGGMERWMTGEKGGWSVALVFVLQSLEMELKGGGVSYSEGRGES